MGEQVTLEIVGTEPLAIKREENYGLFPYPIIRFVENNGGIPNTLSIEWLQLPENEIWLRFVEAGIGCRIEDSPQIFNVDLFQSNIDLALKTDPYLVSCCERSEVEFLRGHVTNKLDDIHVFEGRSTNLPIAKDAAPGGYTGRHTGSILRAADCIVGRGSNPRGYYQIEKDCHNCPLRKNGCSVSPIQENEERFMVAQILERIGVRNIPREAVAVLEKIIALENFFSSDEVREMTYEEKEEFLNGIVSNDLFKARSSQEDYKLLAHDADKLKPEGVRIGQEALGRSRGQNKLLEFNGYSDVEIEFSRDINIKMSSLIRDLIRFNGHFECSEFINHIITRYLIIDEEISRQSTLPIVDIQRNIARELLGLPLFMNEGIDIVDVIRRFVNETKFVDRNSRKPVEAVIEADEDCICLVDRGIVLRSLLNILSDVANHGRRTEEGAVNARIGVHKVEVSGEQFIELSVTNLGYLDSEALAKIGKVIYSRHNGRGHGNGKVSISNLFDRFYKQMGYSEDVIENILQGQWTLVDGNGDNVLDPNKVDKDTTSLRWRILLPVSIKKEP